MLRLSQFVQAAAVHERLPAPFDPRLRMGAWGGTAGVFLYVVTAMATRLRVHHATKNPGFFVVGWRLLLDVTIGSQARMTVPLGVTVIALALELAILTRGFMAGPLWTHLAAVTIAAIGVVALVPVLIVVGVLAFNLALWVLLVVVVMTVVIALIGALLDP